MADTDRRETDLVLTKTLDVLITTVIENSKTQAENSKRTNEMLSKVEETLNALSIYTQELGKAEIARVERDKYQSEKNEKFQGHINKYSTSLDRLVNWHQALDKAKVPLMVMVIVMTGTLFGVNWKG